MPTKGQLVTENRNMWADVKSWRDGGKRFVPRDLPARLIHGDGERDRHIEAMRLTKAQIVADTDALFRELNEWQHGRRVLGRPVVRDRSRSPPRREIIADDTPLVDADVRVDAARPASEPSTAGAGA
jgi:hypothetical protein